MSQLEPDDSRVVHGNAKPSEGDKRFAQEPQRKAEQDDATDAPQSESQDGAVDDAAVRNPGQTPSTRPSSGEDDRQQEQSRDNEAQFEASDLDRGEAQYQAEPLIQQQHQSDDWSDHNDRGASQLEQPQARGKLSQSQSQGKPAQKQDFETGQADYGSAQRKAEQGSAAAERATPDRESDRPAD